MKVWDEDDWDAAYSFCLLCLKFLCSIMSLCLKLITGFSHWRAPAVLSGRPPAAMSDGWFLPVQAVSSAGLCQAFLDYHDCAFLLGACWRRLLWACIHLASMWRGKPSTAAPEARWTLCRAGWPSWGLLHLTHGLAIWCQGWSASSIGETTEVAWSASDREPRSLRQTGGWEPAVFFQNLSCIFAV